MSVPLNGNLGFTSFPGAVVNKPAPSLPVICIQYCSYILLSLAMKRLSYRHKHTNGPCLSKWFVRVRIWLWLWMGHSAVRHAYLTEILECLARCVCQGEMQSWKEDCHSDDSLQSNTWRKYSRWMLCLHVISCTYHWTETVKLREN